RRGGPEPTLLEAVALRVVRRSPLELDAEEPAELLGEVALEVGALVAEEADGWPGDGEDVIDDELGQVLRLLVGRGAEEGKPRGAVLGADDVPVAAPGDGVGPADIDLHQLELVLGDDGLQQSLATHVARLVGKLAGRTGAVVRLEVAPHALPPEVLLQDG